MTPYGAQGDNRYWLMRSTIRSYSPSSLRASSAFCRAVIMGSDVSL